jgi:beta-glucosidase
MEFTSTYDKAKKLLAKMSVDEKIYQLSAQMIFSVNSDYEQNRDHRQGNYRNPGHFMHYEREQPASAKEVAERINLDVRLTMDAHPNAIPPIEHGEALHGAQWGMATCFPQPIGMASTFDDDLIGRVANAIGKECAAVGVRQVLSPVVNITRDCRWGRTMEGFGEDVLLTSNMGAAMCRGLQDNGVIATPKHFADNYSHGGRDSNYSETSERTMREVYLKPFEKCVKDGGAQSIMTAYNAWDGIPCSSNRRLLTDILRNEWGFDGFAVSDYGGVEGVHAVHNLTDSEWRAEAECIKSGLEINLPQSSYEKIKRAYDEGTITDEDIDRAVLRVLKVKYDIGLMDDPFVDPDAADKVVRCDEHKSLALECARSSIVLLRNNGALPLHRDRVKRIAVFGASAKDVPVGKNYSGPYGRTWESEDAKTPLQYLSEYLDGYAEVIFAEDENIPDIAKICDSAIYFTTQIEGEGMDRSDIRLPKNVKKRQEDENAIIVGKYEIEVTVDQEQSIRKMCSANSNSIVVLLGGSPVDMTAWMDDCNAIVEAWYPGEQGARAITEILFGDINPSGKLPITFPRNVGQLPLFYSAKPSGRGKGYIENDGSPLYPFGYGLSYTKFAFANFGKFADGKGVTLSLSVENVGAYDGAELLQVHVSSRNCDVVMPSKELKAYKRIFVPRGEAKTVELQLTHEAFCYYDRNMKYGMHDGDYKLMIGTSCEDIVYTAEASVRSGRINLVG